MYKKIFMILLVIVFLTACQDDKKDEFVFDPYVLVNDLETNFLVGEDVPDFSAYFRVVGEDRVTSQEITHDFTTETFTDAGEYKVTMNITIDDGRVLSEEIDITVELFTHGDIGSVSVEALQPLFYDMEVSYYYTYKSINTIGFDASIVGNTTMTINSMYRQYYHPGTFENVFHLTQDITSSLEENMFTETYMVINTTGIDMYMRESIDGDFMYTELTIDEALGMDYGFDEKYIYDLLDGLDGTLDFKTNEQNRKVIDIPLSTENFSPSTLFEMSDSLLTFGLIEYGDNEELITVLEEKYGLIECQLVLNEDMTEILSIDFQYDEFLTSIIDDFLGEYNVPGMGSFDITEARIVMYNFSLESFEYTLPEKDTGQNEA